MALSTVGALAAKWCVAEAQPRAVTMLRKVAGFPPLIAMVLMLTLLRTLLAPLPERLFRRRAPILSAYDKELTEKEFLPAGPVIA